jgi:hypothetical protein
VQWTAIGASPFGSGLQQWLKLSPEFNMEPYAGLHCLNKPVDLLVLSSDQHVLTNPAGMNCASCKMRNSARHKDELVLAHGERQPCTPSIIHFQIGKDFEGHIQSMFVSDHDPTQMQH